jgi:ubiquinone/menaquinone biosynthesis C-methylase UbiE
MDYTKKVIQNYWDYRSESYSNDLIENSEEEHNAWKAMLSEAVEGKKDLKVLDVGTGPGFLALLFAEMGNEVTAVDLSNKMLEKAKKNASKASLNINFLQGDAENLKLPDGYFDVVVNKYLLWTLPDPKKALMEWRRVLKEDGAVIAIDGEWSDHRLLGRLRRKATDTLRGVKEGNHMKTYRKQYEPIKKDLPLFALKPEQVHKVFKDSGFETVNIKRMNNTSKSSKREGGLLDKLDFADPIYFIRAEK